MKIVQVPMSYVVRYYKDDLAERLAQPRDPATQFYVDWMRNVRGENVLNVGCGPQFYDELEYFDGHVDHYQGIDINENCIEFLHNPPHPRAREFKRAAGVLFTRTYLTCGSIIERQADWSGQFNAVVAVGALGIFSSQDFTQVAKLLWEYLRPGGRLVYIDWRQPRIRPSRIAEKIAYRFCGVSEATVDEQATALRDAGFERVLFARHDVADSRAYGWGRIYGHVLDKQ